MKAWRRGRRWICLTTIRVHYGPQAQGLRYARECPPRSIPIHCSATPLSLAELGVIENDTSFPGHRERGTGDRPVIAVIATRSWLSGSAADFEWNSGNLDASETAVKFGNQLPMSPLGRHGLSQCGQKLACDGGVMPVLVKLSDQCNLAPYALAAFLDISIATCKIRSAGLLVRHRNSPRLVFTQDTHSASPVRHPGMIPFRTEE